MTVRIMIGDALSQLARLPDESVHCVMTSPPYWGLRAYKGDPGMIGLEPTIDAHLENLIAVFREVRRVLRSDGTLWLNYGDAYDHGTSAKHSGSTGTGVGWWDKASEVDAKRVNAGLGARQLLMMPARVAIAVQADGWWLRSEIIWHKNNPMPESCRDRPTSAHEKVFLLSKSGDALFWTHPRERGVRTQPEPDYYWRNRKTHEETDVEPPNWRELVDENGKRIWARINRWRGHDYFYDADAVRVPFKPQSLARLAQSTFDNQTGGPKDTKDGNRSHRRALENQKANGTTTANLRNVWTIPTHSYSEAHFATFPPALVKPCIKAGTSAHGVCGECGAPWVRKGEKRLVPTAKAAKRGIIDARDHAADPNDSGANRQKDGHLPGHRNEFTTTGWSPTCDHDILAVRAICLDPFAGSGTVGLVADRLQRDAILIEISPEYAAMAQRRIEADAGGLFSAVVVDVENDVENIE